MDSFKKCELESDISRVVADFRKSVTGKGPDSVNVFIKGDMIILREKGVFTTQEEELVKTEKGRQIVKQLQVIISETVAAQLQEIVLSLTGCQVISCHSDISTKTGERVEIFVLDKNLERVVS